MSDTSDRAAQLDAIVADYFEVKAAVIIERAVRLLDHDQLHDDEAVDELATALLDALERRYGRGDDGWRGATEDLIHVELDRLVGQRRRAHAALEADLDR